MINNNKNWKILTVTSIATILLVTTLTFSDSLQDQWALAIGSSGIDGFSSSATVGLEIFNPTGPSDSFPINLQGPTVVLRSAPDPTTRIIETEILSMELSGSSPLGPVAVRAGSSFGLPPSTGQITPQGSSDFPAESFFDVFFEIDVSSSGAPIPPLCNNEPLRLEAVIDHLPPTGHVYFPPINGPVLLHVCDDTTKFPVAALTHAYHLPGTNEDLKVEIKKEIIKMEKRSETVRDNTILKGNLKIASGDRVVLVDNAGIGGTSDVEVTWSFSDPDCRVVTLGGIISVGGAGAAAALGGTLLTNDGAFAGNPPHADVVGTDAILVSAETGVCKLVANNGDFVTVSTVGADG